MGTYIHECLDCGYLTYHSSVVLLRGCELCGSGNTTVVHYEEYNEEERIDEDQGSD